MISAGHGTICAALLPHVIDANVQSLLAHHPDSPALIRYDQIAQILTSDQSAKAAEGVKWIHELCSALKVSPLSKLGLKGQDFPTVIAKARRSSSMKGNPIELTDDELLEILKKAI
jgi:alcohol dehydrogenase class IV